MLAVTTFIFWLRQLDYNELRNDKHDLAVEAYDQRRKIRKLEADVIDLQREKATLAKAIRKHRDAKGHERCWLNDIELYKILNEPIPDQELPPLPEFMGECAKYWQGQCPAEVK